MANTSASKSGQIQSASQTNNAIWNRVGHVEVLIWEGQTARQYNFEGLDFKFSVSQILGRKPEGNMSVSICGLSQDTANKLVTLCNTKEALLKRKTLKLYAGYSDPENDQYKGELIATMDIINATIVSPPPDIWLQITAVYAGWLNDLKVAIDIMNLKPVKTLGSATVTNTPQRGTAFSYTKADYVTLEQCLEEICKGLNLLQDKRDVKVRYKYDLSAIEGNVEGVYNYSGSTRHFTFADTLEQIPTKISETYKVNAIWETRDDNDIYLAVYPDPRYAKDLSDKEKNRFTRGKNIKFLDVEHGLIGIPKLKDSIKLECRCFLDGKIKAGDYVSVKSIMLPVIYEMGENIKPSNKSLAADWGQSSWQNDGDKDTIKAYQIMKIKYSGHFRGNDWYCDIEARRPTAVTSLKGEGEPAPRPIRITENYAKIAEGWTYNKTTGAMTKKANK